MNDKILTKAAFTPVAWQRYEEREDLAVQVAFVILWAHFTGADVVGISTATLTTSEAELPALSGQFWSSSVVTAASSIKDLEDNLQVKQPLAGQQAQALNPVCLVHQPNGPIRERNGSSRSHAIELHYSPTEWGLHSRIAFDPTAFDGVMMERTARQFLHVLAQVTTHGSSSRLTSLNLIDQEDARNLCALNAVPPGQVEACVHDLIQETCQMYGESPAVCAWDGKLTYAQLDQLSTRLAHRLNALGATVGTIVPLCFEKSMWTPVAMLAVMKAGAASVVMDTTLPEDRLHQITAQVDATVILASEANRLLAGRLHHTSIVTVSSEHLGSLEVCTSALLPKTQPQDRLYVVFTSGSTGTPKGAVITHANFSTAFDLQSHALGFRRTSRVFDFVSYNFDICWSNALHTLRVGACLCIPSESDRLDNASIARSIRDLGANFANITPTVARLLDPADVPCLQTLLLSGEVMSASDVEKWKSVKTLINTYGQAETTVKLTIQEVRQGRDGYLALGRGVGTNTWVANPIDHSQLVPCGCIGELIAEGPLVGEGYLNNAERTSDTFVRDPPWLLSGASCVSGRGRSGRLYRTGDLVRYRHDGSLDFIGRKDNQVKIRGQRVELGEVEFQVGRLLKGVKWEVQVIAEVIISQSSDRPTLVVFIVPVGAHAMDQVELETWVRETTRKTSEQLADVVPPSMIPSSFIPLAVIPTGLTGKIDRRRLRDIGASHRSTWDDRERRPIIAPVGPVEMVLRDVWAQVLNVRPDVLSVDTPFAQLGGDSITAMQVISRCRARNVGVKVVDILRSQTIQRTATRCTLEQHGDDASSADQSVETDIGDAWDLSPIQRMHLDANPVIHDHYNQSFILKVRNPAPPSAIRDAICDVVRRHSMLRARFRRRESGEWEQHVSRFDPSTVDFRAHEICSLDEVTSEAQRRQQVLNIQNGPVFAVDLFQEKSEGQIILLSAHHLVVDLVSWRIIWHDLQASLDGLPLEKPTMSFRTWCRKQQLEGQRLNPGRVLPFEVSSPQFDYWGVSPAENLTGHRQIYTQHISAEVTSLLLGKSNEAFETETADVLIAMLRCTFRDIFTDREPPTMFLEGHGREPIDGKELDVSDTVGWFTTIYPLEPECTPGCDKATLVRMAKNARLQMPGNGRPYFACRYHSEAGERQLMQPDGIEVLFNYWGRFQQLEGAGSRFTALKQPIRLETASPDTRREGLIEVTVDISNGQMRLQFVVNRWMTHQRLLQRWTAAYAEALSQVAYELLDPKLRLIISDFPLLSISQSALDTLIEDRMAPFGITAKRIADIFPCSPLQEGMQLSKKRATASYANYTIWDCNVKADKDTRGASIEDLFRAWELVVGRHSVFRTIFTEHPETGRSIQVLLQPGGKPHIRSIDSASFPPARALETLDPIKFRPQDPEYQITLCRGRNGSVACRLDMSHSLSDLSSTSVLMRDLKTAYDRAALGPAPQFREVIGQIVGTCANARMNYWIKSLQDVRSCVFPAAETHPNQQTRTHGALDVQSQTFAQIDEFCKSKGITRSAFVQTAWAMVLSRWLGTDQPCFGYLASGRDLPIDNIGDVVGPLVSMLVGRVDLSKDIQEVLRVTSRKAIDNFEFQHVSLADLQHHLGIDGQQLFNTVVTVHNIPQRQASTDGLQLSHRGGDDAHEFDLTLEAALSGAETAFVLHFKHDTVGSEVAYQLKHTLVGAVELILESGRHNMSSRGIDLRRSFFFHQAKVDEEAAMSFWRNQFESSEAPQFPAIPSHNFRPQADAHLEKRSWNISWAAPGHTYKEAVIRAAWAWVQLNYTATTEAVFGVRSDGRQGHNAADGELTAVTVPMRVCIDNEMTARKFLDQVQAQTSEMSKYERTGMQRIRGASQDAEQCCRFQTLLNVHLGNSIQVGTSQEQILEARSSTVNSASVNPSDSLSSYALVLDFDLEPAKVHLQMKYDPGALHSKQAARILAHFERVLQQITRADCAEMPLADIELASQSDLNDIWAFNATVADPVERCVHELVGDTMRRLPNKLAVDAWDGMFTYAELDDLSARLAVLLVELGVRPGVNVPLLFEKSVWMPVAMLGVMRAGGACVAVDVTQPEARLRRIVEQVHPLLILSSIECESTARKLHEGPVQTLGRDVMMCHKNADLSVLPRARPDDIFHIVFTSGSTGEPKGTLITHRNFSTALGPQTVAIHISETSRVYDFVSYSFDFAWTSSIAPLFAGGCLCIPSESDRKNDIEGSLKRSRATFAFFTPSLARSLPPDMEHVPDTIILGGESTRPGDAKLFNQRCRLMSVYGPSECTVMAMCTADLRTVPDQDNADLGFRIGHLTHQWVVQLGSKRKLAALGAVGELWVEGPLLGNGYLDDPERTAAAFAFDPPWLLAGSSGHPGRRGRVYKTGDLVRYRVDGSLEFYGRKDSQVKVRGQRVELGEVEHHVTHNLATRETVLQTIAEVVTPRGAKRPRLVTFLYPRNAEVMTKDALNVWVREVTSDIDERLAKVVPTYMVPTSYIPIATLPTTATGKIHRRTLRQIAESLTAQELDLFTQQRAMRNPVRTSAERRLQQLWASVLEVEDSYIGADDSFLRMGGDSVAAMRLVASARRAGLALTVADVLQWPRLNDMASRMGVGKHDDCVNITNIAPFTLLEGIVTDKELAREQAAILCGVNVTDIADMFPCTPLQEGMLALTAQRAGDYVSRTHFALPSTVVVDRLKEAWMEVVRSAQILRTMIVSLPSCGLVQVVIEPLDKYLPSSEVSAQGQTNMGLGTPLCEAAFVKDQGKDCFVLTMHHALYDGWSKPRLLQALEEAYNDSIRTKLSPLQAFVSHVQSIDLAQAESFWQAQLDGSETTQFPPLPAPSYRPRADSSLEHTIRDIKWIGRDYTPNAAIRAAWSVLQSTYTGSGEACFGAVVSGRQAAVPGIEQIAGPTIATVPVRIMIDSNARIEQLLDQVQTQALDMITWEQTGLQRIRRMSKDAEQSCQFQTLISVQPRAKENNDLSILSKQTVLGAVSGANDHDSFNSYALLIDCKLEETGLQVLMSHDAAVVDHVMARRIAWQFENILRQLMNQDLNAKLDTIDVVSPQDLQNIWDWNQTQHEEVWACVHTLISETARRQPDAPAICAWDGDLTHSQLDSLSTRFAHVLLDAGVGSGAIVPVCIEKSMWVAVAVLAIFKAGAATVILDVTLPEGRLCTIAKQVSASVIVSSQASKHLAARLNGSSVITADYQSLKLSQPLLEKRLPKVSPSDRLYVVFTSGTTGLPKGIVISHANFCSAFKHQSKELGFKNSSRVFDYASAAFDVVWSNLLHTLHIGACLCIPHESERRGDIAAAMRRLNVNFADLTPTVGRLLEPTDLPNLEALLLGGEFVSAADAEKWRSVPELRNNYGPAETTVKTTVERIVVGSEGDPSIGRGIGGNVWVTDLNDHRKLVPIGCVGELLFDGPLVAQGYLNNPGKTAAAFVEDPPWLLRGAPGIQGRHGRLYRTGDVVKYTPEGKLTFLGRVDDQVKLRGQRIELGEVEYHVHRLLSRNVPEGDYRVVADVVRLEGQIQKSLVAFISPAGTTMLNEEDLHTQISKITTGLNKALSELIPASMIPAGYIPLLTVPTSQSGKTDRRQLRKIGASFSLENISESADGKCSTIIIPSTAMEIALRDVWAQVLNIPTASISTDAQFTTLGGDSITAMQVMSRCRAQGFNVTAASMLSLQTIRRIAPKCEIATRTQARIDSATASDDEDPELAWMLSPMQAMSLRENALQPSFNNQSFLLRARAPMSFAKIASAVCAIVERHHMLRARFRYRAEKGWEQYVPPFDSKEVRVRDHGALEMSQIQEKSQLQQRSLDIYHGPVFSVDVFEEQSEGQVLLFSAHHLVVDLVSWRVIWNDFQQALEGKPLLESTSFQKWCQVQYEEAMTSKLTDVLPFTPKECQLEYWGMVGQPNTLAQRRTVVESIDPVTTHLLLGRSNEAFDTEPKDVLVAILHSSFKVVFPERETPDIWFEGHGREQVSDVDLDIAGTVGWFATFFPIQLHSPIDPDPIAAVKAARDIQREVPGKGRPYFAWQCYNQQQCDEQLTPAGGIEVLFNYTGRFQQLEDNGSLLTTLNQPVTLHQAASSTRRAGIIEVTISMKQGQLEAEFEYNMQMKHGGRISIWATAFIAMLRDVVHTLAQMPSV